MKAEEMAAVVAAGRLLGRYAHLVDANDAPALALLFTEDGRLEGLLGGGELVGRPAIEAYFLERERVRDPNLPRRRHHITSIDAWLDGDGTLRASSYFHVLGPGGLVAGVYEDEFAHDDGEWRIRRKRAIVEQAP